MLLRTYNEVPPFTAHRHVIEAGVFALLCQSIELLLRRRYRLAVDVAGKRATKATIRCNQDNADVVHWPLFQQGNIVTQIIT